MKWHKLMILLASLMLIAVAVADEFEIPDDIDDDDLHVSFILYPCI